MSSQPTVTLYHVQNDSDLKMHRAIAKGNDIALQTIDISEEPLTPRQLFQISNRYEGGLNGLMDKGSKAYQAELKGHDFSNQELLEILVKKPELLKLPIIVHQKETYICNKPRDILKFSSVNPKIDSYDHTTNINQPNN